MKQYSHLRDAGARAAAAAQAEAAQPVQVPDLSLPLQLLSLSSPDDILQMGRDARNAGDMAKQHRRRSGAALSLEPLDVNTVDVQREVGIDLARFRHQVSVFPALGLCCCV